jgi:hypothetical protein
MAVAVLASLLLAALVGQFAYTHRERADALAVGATVAAALLAVCAIAWALWQTKVGQDDLRAQRADDLALARAERRAEHRLAVLRDLSDLQDAPVPENQRRLRARNLLVLLGTPDPQLPALNAWTEYHVTPEGDTRLREIAARSGVLVDDPAQYDNKTGADLRNTQSVALWWTDPNNWQPTAWSNEVEAAIRATLDSPGAP